MHWPEFHRWRRRASVTTGLRKGVIVGILLLGLALGPAAYAQSTPDSTNWVEVRLHHDLAVQSAQFTAERGTLAVVLPSGGAPILQLRPDEAVTLGRRQSDVYARHGESALYARSLHLVPSSEAAWTLKLAPGSTRTYTGSLRLSRSDSGSGVQLVNRVPLSDYVASVVAGARRTDCVFCGRPITS